MNVPLDLERIGGLHLNYKVNPDILILGKAMGNGYPITAILGKKKLWNLKKKLLLVVLFGQND